MNRLPPTIVSIAATLARLMIETTFRATSEKLWPLPTRTFGRSAQFLGMKLAAKNRSTAARPSACSEVAAHRLLAACRGLSERRLASS